MVQTTYTPAWLNEEFFTKANPRKVTITDCAEEVKQNGQKELVLYIRADNDEAKLSLWGSNKARCAKQFGNGRTFETTDLIGKTGSLSLTTDMNGKKIKFLEF